MSLPDTSSPPWQPLQTVLLELSASLGAGPISSMGSTGCWEQLAVECLISHMCVLGFSGSGQRRGLGSHLDPGVR